MSVIENHMVGLGYTRRRTFMRNYIDVIFLCSVNTENVDSGLFSFTFFFYNYHQPPYRWKLTLSFDRCFKMSLLLQVCVCSSFDLL